MSLRDSRLIRIALILIALVAISAFLFPFPRLFRDVGRNAPSSPTLDVSQPGIAAGTLFAAGQLLSPFELHDPSHRYFLRLAKSGQLSLEDVLTRAELFVSDTEYFWPVLWELELSPDGVLKLSWSSTMHKPHHGTPWTSSMLPNCDPVPGLSKPPVLEITPTGQVQIRSGDTTICVLHRAVDDPGRLALVYTGFLRTYLDTCDEHKEKLVKTWTGSGGVDVHVFAYYDDVYHKKGEAVDKKTVDRHLKACFGPALKTVELHKLADVEETVPDAAEVLLQDCPQDKLDRQISQWKALYLAGQQVQDYMIREGITYDYLFKGRLDLQLWGSVPALSDLSVPPSTIVAPRVALDWTWYSTLHTGEQRAGITDITAFGRPAEMFTYLGLYHEFVRLRTEEKARGRWKAFNSKQRIRLSDGQEVCTPESILAYWLGLNGIRVRTDWKFQMGLLRKSGDVVFTCPTGRNFLCPGFTPRVADDGTLY